MKTIKNKVAWLYNSYIWNPYHLWNMKRKAIQLHKATKRRYYVIPISENRLGVVDNTFIGNYNRIKGVRKINHLDLIKMAYYATPAKGLCI